MCVMQCKTVNVQIISVTEKNQTNRDRNGGMLLIVYYYIVFLMLLGIHE